MRYLPFALASIVLIQITVRAADEPTVPGLDGLQGTWEVVRFERDTKVSSAVAIKDRILTIKGSAWTDKTGEKLHGKGTLKIAEGQTGKVQAIDALFDEGFLNGKTSKAIFQLDGDTLKACSSRPGDPRPAGFETALKSGRMLVEYKRKSR